MDSDDFVKKIRSFLDKKEVDVKDQYFIAKQLEEELWTDVQGSEAEEMEEESPFDEGEEEEELPSPPPSSKKKKPVLKKPGRKEEEDF